MKSDKKQTLILVSISLIILGAIIVGISFSMPKVYSKEESTVTCLASSEIYNSTTVVSTTNNNYYDSNSNSVATNANSSSSSNTTTSSSVSFPLNLNSCTSQELQQINGVGETRANAIISYREYLGGYSNISQLKEIKGIGDGIYAKIAPYVTV